MTLNKSSITRSTIWSFYVLHLKKLGIWYGHTFPVEKGKTHYVNKLVLASVAVTRLQKETRVRTFATGLNCTHQMHFVGSVAPRANGRGRRCKLQLASLHWSFLSSVLRAVRLSGRRSEQRNSSSALRSCASSSRSLANHRDDLIPH